MREIKCVGREFILFVNEEPIELSFCLGVYKYLGIDQLENMQIYLQKTINLFKTAVCIFNENIKRYNREYNGTEKPIRYNELLEALPDSTDGIRKLENWVHNMHIVSQIRDIRRTDNSTQCKNAVKPTVTRLAVLGTSVLGLNYNEVMGLTVGEINEMLDAYNVLHTSAIGNERTDDDLDVNYMNEGVIEPPELNEDSVYTNDKN